MSANFFLTFHYKGIKIDFMINNLMFFGGNTNGKHTWKLVN